MIKEIKDNIKRLRDIPYFWLGKINIVKNDCTTQSNLPIQCNPYQTTSGIFHRTITKNFTICIEAKKILDS